jgi:hypothetical protein
LKEKAMNSADILQVAADMYADGGGDPASLHPALRKALGRTAEMVRVGSKPHHDNGGELRSTQVVAALCVAWEMANPNLKAYGV